MSQVGHPTQILQIGAEKQRQLFLIQDELKLAIRDYTAMITLLKTEPENAFAKGEVDRLDLHISALADDQKVILQEFRKKCAEATAVEPVDPINAPSKDITSSKEKENEGKVDTKPVNPTVKIELDKDIGNGLKKDQSESHEPDSGKSLLSVAPLGERPKHVDNMLPNTESTNLKPRSVSPVGNSKGERDIDYIGYEKFLRMFGLIPVKDLPQVLISKERKRATRQKRSTANHSQFVYDDSWDQDDKKKKKKEKIIAAPVPLRPIKPMPEVIVPVVRPCSRKRELPMPRQQLVKLVKIEPKPKICTMIGNQIYSQGKSSASILEPAKKLLPLPKPVIHLAPKIPFRKPTIIQEVHVVRDEPRNKKESVAPSRTRKVAVEPKRKRAPQKSPIDFSVEKLPVPGWNTTIATAPRQEKSDFASNLKTLIQSAHVPPGLALKIPGLPSSLTIERISEQRRVCCMCRKPALTTGLFGESEEQISDALTSCRDCAMSYHLSCTRSTSTSNEYHICPHCFTKQPTLEVSELHVSVTNGQPSAPVSRRALMMEKIRLATEKEALDKKLIKLGAEVTCTFTCGGKSV